MTPSPELDMRLRRVRLGGLAAAAVGCGACAAGWSSSPERFYAAWLTAYFYWLGIALGCLAVTMLHGMSGGAWGRAIRRVIEAGYQTLPLLALTFVPLWLAVGRIYEWADPAAVRQHEALARKAAYLNVGGFQTRSVVYFAVWIAIAWVLDRVSPNDEPRLESPRSRSLQRRSGLCCIAYGVTMTLAAVDWGMSLEPEWYSTMYGLIHIAGQTVSGLSFAVVVAAALGDREPWSRVVTPQRLNDLGNLLLASVMFWAYCSFFQYLVIWSGNLPEENVWYVHRSQNGWQYLAMGLMALHFAMPFLLLLSRHLKRQRADLARIAALLLVMRYADLYWLIVPGFRRDGSGPQGLTFHWLDVAALAAIGGAWLSVFAWRLPARLRLPMYDPIETEGADEQSGHTAVA
ncbi:MAG: hypothetical protein ACM3U2_01710 [Deltaproteobacteria bacterium]